MFSSPARLKQRTPANGVGREDFLSQLVDEYVQTKSQDARRQVLANLANFAYDPVNFEFTRRVGVIDIFLHVVGRERDTTLLHFAAAGLCNCCLDPLNAEYIVQHEGLTSLIALLQSTHAETLADVITALIYLSSDSTKATIAADSVVNTVLRLQKFEDKRVSNLATIFLSDVAGIDTEEETVEQTE